jgi:hypothetical protein
MINLSTAISGLLLGDVVEIFYLLDVDGFRSTSHFSNVTLDGVLFESNGAIVNVEPPQISSTVDRQAFKITLTDVGVPFGSVAENGLLGLPVSLKMGFINPLTDLPFVDAADYLEVYTGEIDGVSYSINTASQGEKLFIISCTSPMSDLDLRRPVYSSNDYMNKNHPGDTCYEQIYEGSGPISLRWGKL